MGKRDENVVRSPRTSWRRVKVAEIDKSAKPRRLFSSCLKWSQLLGDLTKSVYSRHKRKGSVRAAHWERRASYMSVLWTSWKRASSTRFFCFSSALSVSCQYVQAALSELLVRPSRSCGALDSLAVRLLYMLHMCICSIDRMSKVVFKAY